MIEHFIEERKIFIRKFRKYDRPSEAKIVCRKIFICNIKGSLQLLDCNEGEMKERLYLFNHSRKMIIPI